MIFFYKHSSPIIPPSSIKPDLKLADTLTACSCLTLVGNVATNIVHENHMTALAAGRTKSLLAGYLRVSVQVSRGQGSRAARAGLGPHLGPAGLGPHLGPAYAPTAMWRMGALAEERLHAATLLCEGALHNITRCMYCYVLPCAAMLHSSAQQPGSPNYRCLDPTTCRQAMTSSIRRLLKGLLLCHRHCAKYHPTLQPHVNYPSTVHIGVRGCQHHEWSGGS